MNMKSRKVLLGILTNIELVACYVLTAIFAGNALTVVGNTIIIMLVVFNSILIGGVVAEKVLMFRREERIK